MSVAAKRPWCALEMQAGVLYDLFEFVEKYPLLRAKSKDDLAVNDVVVCYSEKAGKFPTALGTVKHVGFTKLADDHMDGKVGHVFVLPYNKARVNRRKPLNGLQINVLFYLF